MWVANGAKAGVNHYFKHAGAMQIQNTVNENDLYENFQCWIYKCTKFVIILKKVVIIQKSAWILLCFGNDIINEILSLWHPYCGQKPGSSLIPENPDCLSDPHNGLRVGERRSYPALIFQTHTGVIPSIINCDSKTILGVMTMIMIWSFHTCAGRHWQCLSIYVQ